MQQRTAAVGVTRDGTRSDTAAESLATTPGVPGNVGSVMNTGKQSACNCTRQQSVVIWLSREPKRQHTNHAVLQCRVGMYRIFTSYSLRWRIVLGIVYSYSNK